MGDRSGRLILRKEKIPVRTMAPTFDIILVGATGFVGQIVCRSLLNHAQTEPFSWAIAIRKLFFCFPVQPMERSPHLACTPSNLQILCADCNLQKGTATES